MAADRGAFIDQSQSLNIHMPDITLAKLQSLHFTGWKLGLKTGMYYLRSQAAADAIKFTLDQMTPAEEEKPVDQEAEVKKKAMKVSGITVSEAKIGLEAGIFSRCTAQV